jgi:hypothetical protein
MTFQIARSVVSGLPYAYAEEVEKFRQARLAHRFSGDAAPSAPAVVEQAVRRVPVEGEADNFVTDYAIIEDIPAPTLADKKAALWATIRSMEAAALAHIITPARERLMGFDLNTIYGKPETARSDADRALLTRAAEIAARRQVVQRHGAELEVAVEELTAATVDGWTPAGFPS